MTIDFSFYKPINEKQRQFHLSESRHRLLIGGVGAGKTYPSIFESYRHCYKNPNGFYVVIRNTEETLRQLALEYTEFGLEHDLIQSHKSPRQEGYTIILHNGCIIKFFAAAKGANSLKGWNACGFHIDDLNTYKYGEVARYIFTRRRQKGGRKSYTDIKTIWTANWEGRDWLYYTFMHDEETGRLKEEQRDYDGFAWWLLTTDMNPTLGEDFIRDLERTHSEEYINRYVKMVDFDDLSGLIYPDLAEGLHNKDLSFCISDNNLIKVTGIDVGSTVSTVMSIATDGKSVYVYDEWYKRNVTIEDLGLYLQRLRHNEKFRCNLIDPSAARGEMTNNRGESIRSLLQKDFGIRTEAANNAVHYGIEVMKNLMKPAVGEPRLYIDKARCPNFYREAREYVWKEMKGRTEMSQYTQEPVKQNDHALDATRYGVIYISKFLEKAFNSLKKDREELFQEKLEKLPMYKMKPALKEAMNNRLLERNDPKRRSLLEKNRNNRLTMP